MLTKVISGGQTGADRAGLYAARAAGIPFGGYVPRLHLVESHDGRSHVSDPTFAAQFGLVECPDPAGDPPPREDRRAWSAWVAEAYRRRTIRNVASATACIWFGNPHSPGGKLTIRRCEVEGIDHLIRLVCDTGPMPLGIARWLHDYVFAGREDVTLMIAGNRESSAPGIGIFVERFLGEVFNLLATHGEVRP